MKRLFAAVALAISLLIPAAAIGAAPDGWSASNDITITPVAGSWGQAVVGGPFAPTQAQIDYIIETGSLPAGIEAGPYRFGSIAPVVPVSLAARSNDTATYLQQLFAIESGVDFDPAGWPSSAVNRAERRSNIAQLTAAMVTSGGAYQPDFGNLTGNQVKAAATYGGPFSGLNLNPIMAVALYNAANSFSVMACPTREGVIARALAAGKHPSIRTVNRTLAKGRAAAGC